MLLLPSLSFAQFYDDEEDEEMEIKNVYLEVDLEAQASMSKGSTPLWLNANKYGLSSLEESNGYLRAAAIHKAKDFDDEDEMPFDYGFGLDLAGAYGYTSTLVVQQAYGEVRWQRGKLTVGSKEYPMELRDNQLSTGVQTLGINARPIPQVRLALDDFWTIPGTKGWLSLKGHLAYGMMTDNKWQKEFTKEQSKYVENGLYHSKAGYVKIGKEFNPLSLTLGCEMVTFFGGTSHVIRDNEMTAIENESGVKAIWNAFLPTGGGGEVVETTYQNVAGNMLGSWVARLDYKNDYWSAGLYFDHFFEDHSGMFFLDSNGYGTGEEWQQRVKRSFFLYNLKDMQVGFDWKSNLPSWFDSFVVELMYTKYQSGPIYHDHTPEISDHICGVDNYYNNYMQTPYQHWGQVMGNPLILSPIYNTDNLLEVKNNRLAAYHIGFGGHPSDQFSYRVLATFQDAMGTYDHPYDGYKKSFNFMAEASYRLPKHWLVTAAVGLDRGNVHGNNTGAQLTVRKSLYF